MKVRRSILLGASAVLVAWFILHFGMMQFGGMDGSALIQGAWRYYLGQTPLVDFYTVAPPSYIVLPGLAFKLFGPSWHSLVLLTSIYSAVCFILLIEVLQRAGIGFRLSYGISLMTLFCTTISLGWWSYNQTTTIAAVMFLAASAALFKNPKSKANSSIFVIAIVQLSWMKPNVAGFLMLAVAIQGILFKGTRKIMLFLVMIGAIASIALLLISRVNPLLLLDSYLTAGGRLSNPFMLGQCLLYVDKLEVGISLALLMPIISAIIIRFDGLCYLNQMNVRLSQNNITLAVISFAAFLIGILTNNDLHALESPMFVVGAILLMIKSDLDFGSNELNKVSNDSIKSLKDVIAHSLTWTTIISYITFFTFVTVSRYRIESIGSGMFFEHTQLVCVQNNRFFQDVMVGPRFYNIITEINQILGVTSSNRVNSTSVFFGPRMEFGYAAYGCNAYKGLFQWWPGTGEASETQIDEVFRNFVEWNPEICIFLKGDFTFIPIKFLEYLSRKYDVTNSENLTILKRK